MKKLYLYVVSDTGTGLVKLGRSVNPAQRLIDMQIGAGSKLKMAGRFETYSHKAESEIHAYFDTFRKHGEWFDIPVDIALKKAKEIAKKYPSYRESVKGKEREYQLILSAPSTLKNFAFGVFYPTVRNPDWGVLIDYCIDKNIPIDLTMAATLLKTTATTLGYYMMKLNLLTDEFKPTSFSIEKDILKQDRFHGMLFTKDGLLKIVHIIDTVERDLWTLEPVVPALVGHKTH